MNKLLETAAGIELLPATTPKASVIWLHGLGADGNDFAPIVPELQLPPDWPVHFVFPHAPMRAVTINNGYVMRAWFDIPSMNIDQRVDEKGMEESVSTVIELIKKEESLGVPRDQIFLAGFSQGAAVVLRTFLHLDHAIGGVLALSGYLPNATAFIANSHPQVKTTPLFIAHGTEDTIVPYTLGLTAYDAFKRAGFTVDWHSYSMAHSVCAEEVQDISKWLKRSHAV